MRLRAFFLGVIVSLCVSLASAEEGFSEDSSPELNWNTLVESDEEESTEPHLNNLEPCVDPCLAPCIGGRPLCCAHVYFGASLNRVNYVFEAAKSFSLDYHPMCVPAFRVGLSMGQGFTVEGSYMGYDTFWIKKYQGATGLKTGTKLQFEVGGWFSEQSASACLQYDKPLTERLMLVPTIGIRTLFFKHAWEAEVTLEAVKNKLNSDLSLNFSGLGSSIGLGAVNQWWWGGVYLSGAVGAMTGIAELDIKLNNKLLALLLPEGILSLAAVQGYSEVHGGFLGECQLFSEYLFLEWRIGMKELRCFTAYPVALLGESGITFDSLMKFFELFDTQDTTGSVGQSTIQAMYFSLTIGF